MTITISQNQYHVLVINMKLKVYKLIALFCVGILVMLISVFSVILAVALILVLCFFYLINKKIKEKIYAYDKYPTSTGSASRISIMRQITILCVLEVIGYFMKKPISQKKILLKPCMAEDYL